MKQLLTVVLLLTASAAAQASPVETWECGEYRDSKILVTATVEPGRKKGSIAVAGVKHATVFQVTGFDRRWDFGLSNNRSQYAFIIEPNGKAKYYDFGKKSEASASNLMQCIETGAAIAPN